MDIYILNRNFKIIDVCDDYESVIWTTRYYTYGDFELYMPATDRNINLFKEDLYLVRDKDILQSGSDDILKNVMIIKKISIQTDIENGNHLTVSGYCLKYILTQRIVWYQTTLSGTVEDGIRSILTENVINPSVSDRKITQLQLGNRKGFTDKLRKQVTGKPVNEFLTDVCMSYSIGFDIYVKNGIMIFELYKGENRSYSQSVNPYVVFSPEYENLLASDYTRDKTGYKNVVLVAGEGEGVNRKTVSVGTAAGLDRYEIYSDSRNQSTNDGEITEAEYNSILAEEGAEVLAEPANNIVETSESEIDVLGNYVLNRDYFLGDIVEIVNEYGIEQTPRVVEIIESEDENGSSTIPTFSTQEV